MDRARIFGDMRGGYITTPVPRVLWAGSREPGFGRTETKGTVTTWPVIEAGWKDFYRPPTLHPRPLPMSGGDAPEFIRGVRFL